MRSSRNSFTSRLARMNNKEAEKGGDLASEIEDIGDK